MSEKKSDTSLDLDLDTARKEAKEAWIGCKYKEALRIYQDLQARFPSQNFYRQIGGLQIELKNELKAIQAFKKWSEIEPHNPFTHLELGLIHDKRGELKAALDSWREVHDRLRTPLKMLWWLLTRNKIPRYKGEILGSFVRWQIRSLKAQLANKAMDRGK